MEIIITKDPPLFKYKLRHFLIDNAYSMIQDFLNM